MFNAWNKADTIHKGVAHDEEATISETIADVREGGQYRIVMQNADGEQFIVSGSYFHSPNKETHI